MELSAKCSICHGYVSSLRYALLLFSNLVSLSQRFLLIVFTFVLVLPVLPHVITHVTSLNTRQEEKAHGRGCFFALLYVLKLGHGSQCIIKVHFGCTSNIRA